MAREFEPQGIHVAHTIIDGQINTPSMRERSPDREERTKLSPDAIAETYWQLSYPGPHRLDAGARPAPFGRELLAAGAPATGYPVRDRREGTPLRGVVQRLQLEGTVHPAQGVQYELVGEPGVLGEERAVEVSAVGV